MPSSRRKFVGAAWVGVCLLAFSGCGAGTDPAITAARSRFVRAELPGKPATIAEARISADGQTPVLIAGTIAAEDISPWGAGEATFIVRDASHASDGHEHAAGHDAAGCAFCKRRLDPARTMAVIQFVDEDGQAIKIDARELFHLSEGERVRVQGTCRIDDSDILVVTANELMVVRY